jgi:hypothetical protein
MDKTLISMDKTRHYSNERVVIWAHPAQAPTGLCGGSVTSNHKKSIWIFYDLTRPLRAPPIPCARTAKRSRERIAVAQRFTCGIGNQSFAQNSNGMDGFFVEEVQQ